MNTSINLSPTLLPEALVRALGWTLLHALWQAAFVALLLGLLLVLLHRHSANSRYKVAGGAMLAQLMLSAGTFAYYFSSGATAGAAAVAGHAPATTVAMAGAPAAGFWQHPLLVAQGYFEQHLPLLVVAWLLGLLLMALRFIGGVAYTQRLRHYKVTPLPMEWQHRLQQLSRRLGLPQSVRLVESALVQVPMAIGLAKPVILLPIGAVTGLSVKQVEAVLAHELAHILRRDYLVNLLQSTVDMLFFFHPAMWWISGVVRAERENCCDDVAVALCGDTLTYARALAELEALRLPAAPALAMALSGKRGSLLSRIRRLVGQQSLLPTFSEGFLAALVLVIGLLGLSFGALAGLPRHNTDAKTSEPLLLTAPHRQAQAVVAPTGEEPTDAFAYQVQGPDGQPQDIIIIKNKKGKVTELYVNGKRIRRKDIPKFEDLINQHLEAARHAPKAKGKEVEERFAMAREALANAAVAPRAYSFDYNYDFRFDGDSLLPPPPPPPAVPPVPAPAPPAPPLPPPPPANLRFNLKDLPKEDREKYEKALKEYEKEMEKYGEKIKKLYGEGTVNNQRIREQVAVQAGMARQQVALAQRQAVIARRQAVIAHRNAERMRGIRQEMVKDGLIQEDTKNLNFQLNDEGFFINGKKQPQEVYDKYKKLLQPDGGGKADVNLQYNEN